LKKKFAYLIKHFNKSDINTNTFTTTTNNNNNNKNKNNKNNKNNNNKNNNNNMISNTCSNISKTDITNTGNEKFDELMNNKSKFENQLNTIVNQSSIYLTSLNNNEIVFNELSDNKKQLQESEKKLESIKLSISILQLQNEDNLKLKQEMEEFVNNFQGMNRLLAEMENLNKIKKKILMDINLLDGRILGIEDEDEHEDELNNSQMIKDKR